MKKAHIFGKLFVGRTCASNCLVITLYQGLFYVSNCVCKI